MARKVSASTLRRVLNVWPPFLFAGIRVRTISDDYRHARVELRQRWYSRNFVGTHFGGSLFAMTDPFWMIMTMQALGDGYIVWDKAATIEFVKPGRGTVVAEFRLDDTVLEQIRAATAGGAKHLHWSETPIRAAGGDESDTRRVGQGGVKPLRLQRPNYYQQKNPKT